MVKNKKSKARSVTRRNKKAAEQITGTSDLQDDPIDFPTAPPEVQTDGKGQLGFPDRVYLLAAAIFQNNHRQKPMLQRVLSYGEARGILLPVVKDGEMRHSAYELTFNTLKYQALLEDIMIDSCFHLIQPIPPHQMSLAAVMLYDLQDRKFLPRGRKKDEEVIQEVRDVEGDLFSYKTRLAASLARCRINHNILSMESMLPESLKVIQERSGSLPLYTWVNPMRSSFEGVLTVLRNSGFSQVRSIGQLEGQTFCEDPHCDDMLVFPAQIKPQLYSTKLLRDHKLVIQDKSSCLGPNLACTMLPDEGDILMAGSFSGFTVSHTATLIMRLKPKRSSGSSQPTVHVCVNELSEAQREDLLQVVTDMGCKNVRLIPEVFHSLDGANKELQKVSVILLTPKCSLSAVSNPVEIILQENGDTGLLQELSHGSITQSKLDALVAQQRKDIAHALQFPQVVAVVYSTCSSNPEENEVVVNGALEQAKASSEQPGTVKQANFSLAPSVFKSQDGPVSPQRKEPFFTLQPTHHSNGCFLALLIREVEEAPPEVPARANAKGLAELSRKDSQRKSSKMKKATLAQISRPQFLGVGDQAKDSATNHVLGALLSGQQETLSRQLLTPGKNKSLRPPKSDVFGRLSSPRVDTSSRPENMLHGSKSSTPASKLTASLLNHRGTTTINAETSTTSASSAASTCPPPAPRSVLHPPPVVVRPRRAPPEALKPKVMVLPSVRFPDFFPPLKGRMG